MIRANVNSPADRIPADKVPIPDHAWLDCNDLDEAPTPVADPFTKTDPKVAVIKSLDAVKKIADRHRSEIDAKVARISEAFDVCYRKLSELPLTERRAVLAALQQV